LRIPAEGNLRLFNVAHGSMKRLTKQPDELFQSQRSREITSSSFEAPIGYWITDSEMVNHLSLVGRQVEITMDPVIVEGANAGCGQSERFGGEIQSVTDGACFEMHVPIAAGPMSADRTFKIADHRECHTCIASEVLTKA
jgi:hypothetical protein